MASDTSTSPTPRSGSGLRGRAARGVVWTSVDSIGSRLVSTVVFVVLARLLTPADFGLVALALVFVALARLLVDQGFGFALVQRVQIDKGHLDTAFWASVAGGIVLAGALSLAAVPISTLVGSPDLAPVLMALSLVVVVGAPSSTATAILKRDLAFRSLAFRRLAGAVAGGTAGVVAALAGLGVWSLVAQALVQTLVNTVTLWALTPYRPGLGVSRRCFRDLFGFGNRVLGIHLATFASHRSDDLLIGAVLGPAALGLYSVAYRLLTIMTETLTLTVEHVAFPTFAKLQTEIARLSRAYQAAITVSASVTAPAYLAAAVLAPDLVIALFGPRWESAGPVMQALSVAGFAQALVAANHTLLLALGEARLVLRLNVTYALFNVVGFLIAVQFGILAVAIAFAARAYVLAPLSILPATRRLGLSWTDWCRPLLPAVLCSITMASGLAVLLNTALDGAGSVERLVVAVPIGALVYLTQFRLAFPGAARELWGQARSLRRT